MAEVHISVPEEYIDRLKEGCQDCWVARFTLQKAISIQTDLGPIIDHINENCGGWRGETSPQKSIINPGGEIALAMSASIEENCSYVADLG